MKKIILTLISLLILVSLVLSGCGSTKSTKTTTDSSGNSSSAETTETADNSNLEELFSSRDLSGDVQTADAVKITLSGNTATASSSNVSISGSTVTIKAEGTYILSGSLQDGSIIVNVSKEEKVTLVLNGVSITSKTFAPIYVVQADKVFITLSDGTTNTLENGGSFKQIDDNNVDAVIFSKDDITLNGTGTLTIKSPAGHGIVANIDEKSIGQLVTILVDNAISHTTKKGEEPAVVKVDLSSHKGNSVLTISNPGEAIPESERDKIFERFYRTDNSHEFTGHYGLGLAIAKNIANINDAKISVSCPDGLVSFKVVFK